MNATSDIALAKTEDRFDSDALLLHIRQTHSASQARLIELLNDLEDIQLQLSKSVQDKIEIMYNECGLEFNTRVTEIVNMRETKEASEAKLKKFYEALMSSFDQFF